jgi:hypothetical protein
MNSPIEVIVTCFALFCLLSVVFAVWFIILRTFDTMPPRVFAFLLVVTVALINVYSRTHDPLAVQFDRRRIVEEAWSVSTPEQMDVLRQIIENRPRVTRKQAEHYVAEGRKWHEGFVEHVNWYHSFLDPDRTTAVNKLFEKSEWARNNREYVIARDKSDVTWAKNNPQYLASRQAAIKRTREVMLVAEILIPNRDDFLKALPDIIRYEYMRDDEGLKSWDAIIHPAADTSQKGLAVWQQFTQERERGGP